MCILTAVVILLVAVSAVGARCCSREVSVTEACNVLLCMNQSLVTLIGCLTIFASASVQR